MDVRVTVLLGVCLAACGNEPEAGAAPRCGDGRVDAGEACDDGSGNGRDPDRCREGCVLPACGDGIRDSGEGCDEGVENADDRPGACRTSCEPAGCGDGVVDPDEACDEGDGNDDLLPDACRTDCRLPACGDGVPDTGEACDDGAENSDTTPDACRPGCVLPSCGDGVVDRGESCDLGRENDDRLPDRCRTDCGAPRCGDGVRDAGEACDSGTANSDERPGACRTSCVVPRCGDGVVDGGEECDSGGANSDTVADACRTECLLPVCGDGVVDPAAGETCEDGNDDRTDGCHLCAWHVDRCRFGGWLPIDVSGGAPWDGGELVLTGTLAGATDRYRNWGCNREPSPDQLYALPISRSGDLVVRVSSTDGSFVPSVELRRECQGGTSGEVLACANADGPDAEAVAVARGVSPADTIRWFNIEAVAGVPGPYRVSVAIVPSLAAGEPCSEEGASGSCAEGLLCHDPDGDGVGMCRPLVSLGGACDPAGVESLCVESVCACSSPGCTAGSCVSTCGDGTIQPWEECEDDDVSAADNCTPECRLAGRSCAVPYRLDLSPGLDGRFEWQGDTSIGAPGFTASCGHTGDSPEVHASFTAPEAGAWVFRVIPLGPRHLTPPAWTPVLSLGTGTCEAGEERACASILPWTSTTPTIRLPLDEGETVWTVVDGDGLPGEATAGAFTLVAQRVVCGDGVVGLDEPCDDGNSSDLDNCLSSCTAAGASCETPWTLEWDAARHEASWTGLLSRGGSNFTTGCGAGASDLVARFAAPAGGTYAFELSSDDVLSLRSGACETSAELECRYHSHRWSTRVLTRELAAGEAVWVVVDARRAYRPDDGAFSVRVRPLACGDGELVRPEECDDGGTADGDGCSSTCRLEAAETEPNDVQPTADPVAIAGIVTGSLDPETGADWFRFDATAGTTYTVELSAGTVGNCTRPGSTGFPLFDVGVFDGSERRLAWDPAYLEPGTCLRKRWVAPASGTFWVRVGPVGTTTVPRYFLELR